MSLLRTAASWFVEPEDEPPLRVRDAADPTPPPEYRLAGPRGRTFAPPVPPDLARPAPGHALELAPANRAERAPRIAVIGSLSTAPPLAAAVALRSRGRASAAVVALWRQPGFDGPPPGPGAPALPGAASLASRFTRGGLPAVARGRLVWLLLPAVSEEAAAGVRQADAAGGDAALVIALARPRDAPVDAVVATCDLALVAAPPGSSLAELALDDIADLRVPARAHAPLPPGPARLAALAGLTAPALSATDPARTEEALA
jgi:hypothetical protein